MYIFPHSTASGGRVTMEKFGDYVKKSVLNFKLEQCCWVASVRTGALTLACVNIILGLTILVVLSEEVEEGEERSFIPLLLQALQKTTDLEEDVPDFKSTVIIAYAVEIASNALLICAMWRNDIVLLRAYLYYSLGVLTLAVMVYSVVIAALTVIPELLLIASVGTQLYQIILVRSAMVEIKQASIKNGYTVNLKPNDKPSSSGPNEKYTVTIETEKPKLPPKPVTKGDISKPMLKEVVAKAETDKTSVTVHSPAKQAFLHEDTQEAKEGIKPSRVFVKEKVKIERAKPERIEVTKKV